MHHVETSSRHTFVEAPQSTEQEQLKAVTDGIYQMGDYLMATLLPNQTYSVQRAAAFSLPLQYQEDEQGQHDWEKERQLVDAITAQTLDRSRYVAEAFAFPNELYALGALSTLASGEPVDSGEVTQMLADLRVKIGAVGNDLQAFLRRTDLRPFSITVDAKTGEWSVEDFELDAAAITAAWDAFYTAAFKV
jgi:hypothetical protein